MGYDWRIWEDENNKEIKDEENREHKENEINTTDNLTY